MEEHDTPEETEDVKQKEHESTEKQNDIAGGGEASGKAAEETTARYNRLKLFDKVIQKSLNRFIENASFKVFSSKFRPLYKENVKRMEEIHNQFTVVLQKSIQEDIIKLMEEGKIESKFQELDKLENEAKDNPEPAWRPSGVPKQDFCSFLMPYYQKQKAYMKLELKKIQAENAALAERVRAGREKIAQTEQCISTDVDEWNAKVIDFERVASSLNPVDFFDE